MSDIPGAGGGAERLINRVDSGRGRARRMSDQLPTDIWRKSSCRFVPARPRSARCRRSSAAERRIFRFRDR